MSFWKKLKSFFAEADTPEEAVRIFADASKGDDARRAQIAIVESLSDRIKSDEPNARPRASAAFTDLTRTLSDPQPWVRATALRGLRELAGVFRYDVDHQVVRAALSASLPLLRDADPGVRERAGSAVTSMSDILDERERAQIADAIRPLCDDPVAEVRAGGAIDLGSCGAAAQSHLGRVVQMLDEEDERVRGNAACALWMIGVPTPPRSLVEKLVVMLHSDPSARVRADVANALGKVGASMPELAAPALLRAVDDGEKDVRHFAIFAFCDLGPAGAPAVPRLSQLLGSPDHKDAAIFALKAVGDPLSQQVLAQHGIPLD